MIGQKYKYGMILASVLILENEPYNGFSKIEKEKVLSLTYTKIMNTTTSRRKPGNLIFWFY